MSGAHAHMEQFVTVRPLQREQTVTTACLIGRYERTVTRLTLIILLMIRYNMPPRTR
jgi:hypothetical protein